MELKKLMQESFLSIQKLESRDYLKAYLIYYIAPTIVGEKPSTIVTINNKKGIKDLWFHYGKEVIKELEIDVHILKEDDKKITLMLYHPSSLMATLEQQEHTDFLLRFGYKRDFTLQQSLEHLKSRFEYLCPHEMGIFLGFPLDEVMAYINCPNEKCLLCGYWKVYKDQKYAKEKFQLFDQLRCSMLTSFIEEKIVA